MVSHRLDYEDYSPSSGGLGCGGGGGLGSGGVGDGGGGLIVVAAVGGVGSWLPSGELEKDALLPVVAILVAAA
jgi:hypothetical protein